MLVDIYSGANCWVLAPRPLPPPSLNYGRLNYEGTVPARLIRSDAVSAHAKIECALKSYARVPEDTGVRLLDACRKRYGTLALSVEPYW